jgi:hypothetical protein
VLGVAGVDLVRQLAGGLAGLVVLALAAQQLQDLVLVNIHDFSFATFWAGDGRAGELGPAERAAGPAPSAQVM